MPHGHPMVDIDHFIYIRIAMVHFALMSGAARAFEPLNISLGQGQLLHVRASLSAVSSPLQRRRLWDCLATSNVTKRNEKGVLDVTLPHEVHL